MNIIVTHANSFDYEKEFYAPLKKAVEGTGHELIFPHIWREQKKSAKEFLKDAGMIIGEVSYPSTGQGIEFGLADLFSVPILFLRKKGAVSSSSLCYLKDEMVDYEDENDLVEHIRTFLASRVN